MPVIKRHQTLIDVATQLSGDATALVPFALLNGAGITDDIQGTDVSGIGVLNENVVTFFQKKGREIATLLSAKFQFSDFGVLLVRKAGKPVIKVNDTQTLLDAALFIAGDVKAFFSLAVLNGFAITDDFYNGQVIQPVAVITKDVVKAFEKARPATAIKADTPAVHLEGIDYWAIELDFVVS